jgi:hypothetical protein
MMDLGILKVSIF